MSFKDFLESQGAFGPANMGSEAGVIKQQMKLAQPVKGKGSSVRRQFSAGPKVSKPARPVAPNPVSLRKPWQTIPSNF